MSHKNGSFAFVVVIPNENAGAFTYLPRAPNSALVGKDFSCRLVGSSNHRLGYNTSSIRRALQAAFFLRSKKSLKAQKKSSKKAASSEPAVLLIPKEGQAKLGQGEPSFDITMTKILGLFLRDIAHSCIPIDIYVVNKMHVCTYLGLSLQDQT